MSKIVYFGAFRLYIPPGRHYWYIRAEHPKLGSLFQTTKCTEIKKATKKAKELYQEWLKEPKLKPGSEILFVDLWEDYVEKKRTEVSPSTMKIIELVGRLDLIPYFGNLFLTEIARNWSRFVTFKRAKNQNSSLINQRKYLRNALVYAVEIEVLEYVPILKLERRKTVTPKIFTEDEVKGILGGCEKDESLKLQVIMGYAMGMRHGEICAMSLDRIDLSGRTMTLRDCDVKTRKGRTIQISDSVFEILKSRVLRLRGQTRWLFPMKTNPFKHESTKLSDRSWNRLKSNLGIEGRFHDLRHTAATRLGKSNVPPAVAAAYLGMSLKVFSDVYCHLGVQDTAKVVTAIDVTV